MQQNHTSITGGEIIVAKFDYHAQETHELTIEKNERLLLLDGSCLWWKVKRMDADETGYIPSNFARREKRSLLDKIISKRITKKAIITNGHPQQPNHERVLSSALVKFRYEAESEDEISLNKGLWVSVLQKKNDGWWLIQYDKQRGWFPSNYLIEKTADGLNSLSLLNQLNHQRHCPPSPISSNGLSSSSSANSNLVEPLNVQQIRHNSHPLHIPHTPDEYSFGIKPPQCAHSDGRLDTCNHDDSFLQEPKNSSCSALLRHEDSSHSSRDMTEEFQSLTLKKSPYINERWYYGSLTRDVAEKYLKSYGHDRGNFLIRDSERRTGSYSLSIRADEETIRHFRIEQSEDETRYLIGKRSFPSLHDLIEHYKTHPVFDGDQTKKLFLNQPLIVTDSNPHL